MNAFGIFPCVLLRFSPGIESKTKTKTGNKLINFEKLRLVSREVQNIAQYSSVGYNPRSVVFKNDALNKLVIMTTFFKETVSSEMSLTLIVSQDNVPIRR